MEVRAEGHTGQEAGPGTVTLLQQRGAGTSASEAFAAGSGHRLSHLGDQQGQAPYPLGDSAHLTVVCSQRAPCDSPRARGPGREAHTHHSSPHLRGDSCPRSRSRRPPASQPATRSFSSFSGRQASPHLWPLTPTSPPHGTPSPRSHPPTGPFPSTERHLLALKGLLGPYQSDSTVASWIPVLIPRETQDSSPT